MHDSGVRGPAGIPLNDVIQGDHRICLTLSSVMDDTTPAHSDIKTVLNEK
jgi:hypothetical protein